MLVGLYIALRQTRQVRRTAIQVDLCSDSVVLRGYNNFKVSWRYLWHKINVVVDSKHASRSHWWDETARVKHGQTSNRCAQQFNNACRCGNRKPTSVNSGHRTLCVPD